MWLGELVFDPSGRRSMELFSKLAASSRRYKLMVGFVCGLGLLCILSLIVTFHIQHQPTGLYDTLVLVLPVCMLVTMSGIILPLCYLVSLRRIGERLVRPGGNAKAVKAETTAETDRGPNGILSSLGCNSVSGGPASWAARVARDKARFLVMLGESVVVHAFPLVVIWSMIKSCPWYQAQPQYAVVVLLLCVSVAALGAFWTIAYLMALRQVLADKHVTSRGSGADVTP